MTKKSYMYTNKIHISSSITLYILFQIRSRRQKEMIEGGYHGLEGGFEARIRGKRGKGRFWVLNAWNFHSAPPILTLPLATFPTASTAASRRRARGARCCYCCFATSTTPIFQSYFSSFQRSRKGRRKQLENESRKVSASQKLLRRRYGGVRRGVVSAVAWRW